MSALHFPCTLFKTQNRMDDYGAGDMRYGDLSESQLRSHYGLSYLSDRADPWTLTRRSAFDNPRSRFCCNTRPPGQKITRQQCALILFDEFRQLSREFSLYGPYRHLIEKMISHMQYGQGMPFWDALLDRALKEQILGDRTEGSTRLRLAGIFKDNIDWVKNNYPAQNLEKLKEAISDSKLPKFDRIKDSFNGMGITVHDTWATHIIVKSLQVEQNRFRAVVHYKIQDHFGLDDDDISKGKFFSFNLFRIWFVLQRCKGFGFKPFMTNIEASVEIVGYNNERKK